MVSPRSHDLRPQAYHGKLCKLTEHVIYENIIQQINYNNILLANQHGVRKDHSCETQLLLMVEDLARNIDNGDQMDMLILDFSKAVDKVPHERLMVKLKYYGIKGKTVGWIKSWLTNNNNNNNELYLHDDTNTYSIAKAMFRNQNYNTGQLRYFDNNLSRTSKQAEIYLMNCILTK